MQERRTLFADGSDTIRDQYRFSIGQDYGLLFRLNAPNVDETNWSLAGFLQSRHDPSLMLALRAELPPAYRSIAMQQLASAETISRFAGLPILSESIPLSASDAHAFLKTDAKALQEAGFAVQIPYGLNVGKPILPRILLAFDQDALHTGSGLLRFDYKIAMENAEISEEEFQAIAAAKVPLVSIDGKWMELDPDQVARLQKILKQNPDKTSVFSALRLSLSSASQGFETTVTSGKKRFLNILDGLLSGQCPEPLDEPIGFCGKLRPYQKKGVGWIDFLHRYGLGALLADDMGLGKTVQVIASLTRRFKESHRPALVVCPTSVITNWQKEFEKFSPKTNVMVHHGIQRHGTKLFCRQAMKHDVVISSYALTWRDDAAFSKIPWSTVVLDEAQNIKNPLAKKSRHVKALQSTHRIALTGTPVENRLSDVWSIMDFLNPGFLGPWDSFRENFAKPIETEKDVHKQKILQSALSPFLLRRLKTDKSIIRDLPEKTESIEWCRLTSEQATLYQAVVDSSMEKIETEQGEKRRMEILAAITRLKQICNHPANFLKDSRNLAKRSGKVERLRELLYTITQNGQSCLVFSQYAEMASLLHENLQKEIDVPMYYLHGKLQRKKRDEIVDAFQNGGKKPKIFFLSLKAGGTGLNLTNASNVIHFDRWWNPAVENQATDRAHRIGQDRHVFVYKLACRGTIEEKIEAILQQKKELADSIIGSGESLITKMDQNSIRELLTLNSE